ncbi:MAG TPA: tRNA pseudouridine(55) synthase TruB [Desulfatiglandales bacterium]|nr:tRNA pseudouridine(55) synthase TruB [Desulfatiglandales bacterium]
MLQKDGIILVDKEPGPSSFGVIEEIKRLIKVKKIGHAGTLDPFATGVLVVLLNQGTKLSAFLTSKDKVYIAALRLGIETDTQDLTGSIIKRREVGGLTLNAIKEKALQFTGTIKQVPPAFSAVHHNGKRAYELARSGITVDLQERYVRVNHINILSVDLPDVLIEVGCSSGTYIRTLAADLGTSLGAGAHLISLRRIKSGHFHVDESITVKQIAQCFFPGRVDKLIIPLKNALKDMEEVNIPDTLAKRIRNGYKPKKEEISLEHIPPFNYGDYFKGVIGEELVAILKETDNGYDVMRVFT